jgi:flavin-dependent dehydrogenase
VGDAAGLVDPLIGEGIRYAMHSARLGVKAIVSGDLASYDDAVWREIGHSLATAGMAARLFYWRPRACYRLGVQNPITVDHFADLLTGRYNYQGIGRRILYNTVQWMLNGSLKGET